MVLPARMARSWGSQAGFDNGLTRSLGRLRDEKLFGTDADKHDMRGLFLCPQNGKLRRSSQGKISSLHGGRNPCRPVFPASDIHLPSNQHHCGENYHQHCAGQLVGTAHSTHQYPTAIRETERWTCSCNWPAPFILPPAARTRRVAALRRPPRQPGQAETEAY